MWKNLLLGISGLWVILLPFLGFGFTLMRTLFIFTGIVIAVLGFWSATSKRSNRDESTHAPMGHPMGQ